MCEPGQARLWAAQVILQVAMKDLIHIHPFLALQIRVRKDVGYQVLSPHIKYRVTTAALQLSEKDQPASSALDQRM
jgi:hypothetical protein